MEEDVYYVWSNQHHGFWGPHQRGYTQTIELAGEYTLEQATKIVDEATQGGKLKHRMRNYIMDEYFTTYDEVKVKKC